MSHGSELFRAFLDKAHFLKKQGKLEIRRQVDRWTIDIDIETASLVKGRGTALPNLNTCFLCGQNNLVRLYACPTPAEDTKKDGFGESSRTFAPFLIVK